MFASKGILTSMLPDHLRKNLLTFFSMLHKHIDHTLHIAGHRHFFPVGRLHFRRLVGLRVVDRSHEVRLERDTSCFFIYIT